LLIIQLADRQLMMTEVFKLYVFLNNSVTSWVCANGCYWSTMITSSTV